VKIKVKKALCSAISGARIKRGITIKLTIITNEQVMYMFMTIYMARFLFLLKNMILEIIA
tara:strand:+ start:269 stop:448 length:180 start_codon:yes stop_codon:yes gene_type:complete